MNSASVDLKLPDFIKCFNFTVIQLYVTNYIKSTFLSPVMHQENVY